MAESNICPGRGCLLTNNFFSFFAHLAMAPVPFSISAECALSLPWVGSGGLRRKRKPLGQTGFPRLPSLFPPHSVLPSEWESDTDSIVICDLWFVVCGLAIGQSSSAIGISHPSAIHRPARRACLISVVELRRSNMHTSCTHHAHNPH